MNLILLKEFFLSIGLNEFLLLVIIILAIKYFKSSGKRAKNDKDRFDTTGEKVESDEYPQYYPNGWLPVLESTSLKKSQVLPIFAFGNELVAFRGTSGKVTVLDAYCPHLAANLGYGGVVIEDSIKCPFHGWTFNQDGHCTHVPGLEGSNIPKAQIKVWDSFEINDFIFVWNHAKGEKPTWSLPPFETIMGFEKSNLYLGGRSDHKLDCHINDIMENSADVMHLNEVHKAVEVMGNPEEKQPFFYYILNRVYWRWTNTWNPCDPPNEHMAESQFHATLIFFGYELFDSIIDFKLIGPAHILFHAKLKQFNFELYGTYAIMSMGKLCQRVINRFYIRSGSLFERFILKFAISSANEMMLRDAIIWNKKSFLKKPLLLKTETGILKFRRWFKQFLSAD